jgi:uncharacterized protein
MIRLATFFVIGMTLGTALIVGSLTDPKVIIGVLDFAGQWDPTVILFFAAAVTVTHHAYRWILRKTKPVFGEAFHLPPVKRLTTRLFLGSAAFGVGWGLAGLCPGPALTTLGSGAFHAWVFVPSMMAGMWLFRLWDRRRSTP